MRVLFIRVPFDIGDLKRDPKLENCITFTVDPESLFGGPYISTWASHVGCKKSNPKEALGSARGFEGSLRPPPKLTATPKGSMYLYSSYLSLKGVPM